MLLSLQLLQNLFATPSRKKKKEEPEGDRFLQSFVLEQILTPSALVDNPNDSSDDIDLDIEDIDDGVAEDLSGDDSEGVAPPDAPPHPISADDYDVSPWITENSGVFTVGETGTVKVDFLFDGGKYKFELAIFSLDGMEIYEPGSETFIQEAASRALSDSELGYVVISDHSEGALFDGTLGEKTDWNQGAYQGAKTFQMRSGDEFGVMLVANGRVEEVFENPAIGGNKLPLFSMATANPDDAFHMGQLVDIVGDGTTFVMEDQRVDLGTDLDYNDIIFRFDGATGYAEVLDDVADPDNDWRYSELGQRILSYVDESGNALKEDPGDAAYPNNPDPALPIPEIEQTAIDQGGDSLETPTLLEASYTGDIIDQVNPSDLTDIYQVTGQDLLEAEISVLSGDASVSILSAEGEILSQQALSRGTHTLTMPEELSGDVFLKVESGDGGDTTYILRGFAGQSEEPFNIDLDFAEGLTASQQAIVREAAKSVEGFIAEGLPSAIVDGKIIDDINFKISVSNLDGASGTLAQTKIDFMRYGSLLPAQSLVKFDIDDLAELERSGQLFSVVQHELLHGLGFGNLWAAKGLIDYEKTAFSRYKGKQGVEAFKELGGTTDYINLETKGKGSADLHWNEGLFQDELMSADLGFKKDKNGKTFSPLSSVTLASLADLGYKVNVDRATPNWGLLGKPPVQEGEISEADRKALEELIAQSGNEGSSIPTMVEAVDPTTIEPEIWAHAERFDVNGEYYDWQEITIQSGDTVSEYVWDTMTHNSKLDNRSRVVRANDSRYWQFVVDRNLAFGVVNPHLIYAGKNLFLPVWYPNYEAEQAQKQKEKEAELLKKLEEERIERERLEELHRQAGSGGLEWYVAKPLPEFGQNAPFETSVQDVVGSMVPDDYFRFTLSRPGWMTLYLEDLLADADLYLYDSRNRLIGKATRDGVTDEKILMNLAAGTYLARVHSKDGLATDYNLKVRFDGLPTRTQIGSNGKRPTFSDPRIENIFVTAKNKFEQEKWAEVQPEIDRLEREKQQVQRELDALLQQMIEEQKAKVHGALDGVRNEVRGKVDGKANEIKGIVDGIANGIEGAINNLIPPMFENIWWLGDDISWAKKSLKNSVEEARNWLNGKIDEVRNQIKDAIWEFNEKVKDAYRTGGEINASIESAANWLKNKTDKLVNFLNDKVGEFKGQILGKIDWTRSIRIPGGPNLYDDVIVGFVNGIAGNVSNTVSGAGDFFKTTVNTVKPLAQGAVAVIVDKLFGDQTGHFYNEINGINQQIANIKAGVNQAIADQTAFYKGLLDGFLNGLGQAGNFVIGALMGEFNDDPSIWQSLLDAAIGMIPIVGEIGDVRDLIAYTKKFIEDPSEMQDPWNWVGVVGSLVGLVPIWGGAVKGVTKVARNADFVKEVNKLGPTIVNAIIDFVKKTDWSALVKKSSDFFVKKIQDTLKSLVTMASDGIKKGKEVWSKLGQSISHNINQIQDFLAKAKENIGKIKDVAESKIKEAFGKLKKEFDKLFKVRTPYGFNSLEDFQEYGDVLYSGFAKAGYSDVKAIMQGSAATGTKFSTKQPIVSPGDFDVAIVSPSLFEKAEILGAKVRGKTNQPRILLADENYDYIEKLGLADLKKELDNFGKKIPSNFMIYQSEADAILKAEQSAEIIGVDPKLANIPIP